MQTMVWSCLLLVSLLSVVEYADAITYPKCKGKRTVYYYLNVSNVNVAPDGFTRSVYAINGTMPGPTLTVCKGDYVIVKVTNFADESISVHWHGILQYGTIQSDGVPGTTECGIPVKKSYTYSFYVTDGGTYWYHSHSATQYVDGLKAALIVQDPADPWISKYDSEFDLQVCDWYHEGGESLAATIYANDLHTGDPVPDSALFNAHGPGNCNLRGAQGDPEGFSCTFTRIPITSGKRLRLRIINTSAQSVFIFVCHDHTLQIIEADGVTLDGTKIQNSVRLNAAQRYSVIIQGKTNPTQNYWCSATMIKTANILFAAYPNPTVYGVLAYSNLPKTTYPPPAQIDNAQDTQIILKSVTESNNFVDEQNLHPFDTNDKPPAKATLTVHMNITFLVVSPTSAQAAFQGKGVPGFYKHLDTSTLLSYAQHNKTLPKYANNIYVKKGDVVDVIFDCLRGQHPLHMHGHTFWVISNAKQLAGNFKASTKFNLKNPVRRDTFTVQSESNAVIRFVADNPGVWIFHCHIDWHLAGGMAVTIAYDNKDIQALYPLRTIKKKKKNGKKATKAVEALTKCPA